MRAIVLAAAASVAAASPAFAQEKAADYTGIRADVVAGLDAVDDADIANYAGLVYGGSIGYDRQLNNFVIGVEGEITGTTAQRTFFNGTVPTVRMQGGRDIYGGVRAGYVVGKTLLYVKGGYTNYREAFAALQNNAVAARASFTASGWRAGAGFEIPIGRLYAKGEYRYSNYELNVSKHQVVAGIGIRF